MSRRKQEEIYEESRFSTLYWFYGRKQRGWIVPETRGSKAEHHGCVTNSRCIRMESFLFSSHFPSPAARIHRCPPFPTVQNQITTGSSRDLSTTYKTPSQSEIPNLQVTDSVCTSHIHRPPHPTAPHVFIRSSTASQVSLPPKAITTTSQRCRTARGGGPQQLSTNFIRTSGCQTNAAVVTTRRQLGKYRNPEGTECTQNSTPIIGKLPAS